MKNCSRRSLLIRCCQWTAEWFALFVFGILPLAYAADEAKLIQILKLKDEAGLSVLEKNAISPQCTPQLAWVQEEGVDFDYKFRGVNGPFHIKMHEDPRTRLDVEHTTYECHYQTADYSASIMYQSLFSPNEETGKSPDKILTSIRISKQGTTYQLPTIRTPIYLNFDDNPIDEEHRTDIDTGTEQVHLSDLRANQVLQFYVQTLYDDFTKPGAFKNGTRADTIRFLLIENIPLLLFPSTDHRFSTDQGKVAILTLPELGKLESDTSESLQQQIKIFQVSAQYDSGEPECGIDMTIEKGILDCAKLPGSTKSAKGVQWKRVSRKKDLTTHDFYEAWLDSKSKTVWGDTLNHLYAWEAIRRLPCSSAEAAQAGAGIRGTKWALPQFAQFEEAEKDGIREVLPNMVHRWFWAESEQPRGFDGDGLYLTGTNYHYLNEPYSVRCVAIKAL